ncbi:MAG: zinc ribbon domain-containing protein [Synergistaceae bacterium]|jgi:hypothetical protein|nr:zinc ribbon domain-containing protein [Synergistaceae bacterium]
MIGASVDMESAHQPGEHLTITQEEASRDFNIDAMRFDIKNLEGEIARLKSYMGEYYWLKLSNGGHVDPEIKNVFNGIRAKMDAITKIETEMQVIEDGEGQPIQPPIELQINRIICQSCGMVNDGTSKFCSSCGIALKEERKAEYHVEDYGICPLCGAPIPDDSIFCYTCGARVNI